MGAVLDTGSMYSINKGMIFDTLVVNLIILARETEYRAMLFDNTSMNSVKMEILIELSDAKINSIVTQIAKS